MLQISGFSGEMPRIIPRLLPDSAAQIAENCKLVDGAIVPLREPKAYRTVAAGTKTFFKRDTTWFEWPVLVDVAPAPVATNRLYVTGDGVPKIVVDSSTVYPLKVPKPATKLTVAIPAEQVTATINHDATAADVKAALEALSEIGAGNLLCTGGPLPATAVKITFQGALANRSIATLLIDTDSLSGGSSPDPSIDHTTSGTTTTNDVQTLSISGAPTGGTFKLAFNRPDPSNQASILYAYTYVTAYDEESEPSDLSDEVLRSFGIDVTLGAITAPPAGRNINRLRIYRSQTSLSGSTDLYFIKELPVPAATTFVDNVEKNAIQEAIPSLYYNPPPDDLSGIIALPNGMMAGFVGKKLYFCEPWHPHAWPEKYILTTNYDIVGLGCFGQTVVILTTGFPYVATGNAPDSMIMTRLEVNYPCLNKRGIVDLGYSVAYPSTDGLVAVSANGAGLATAQLMTRDQWQQIHPDSLVAAQYEGRYVASYSYTDDLGIPQRGAFLIDLTGEQPFLIRLDLDVDFMFFEIGVGKLYILLDDAVTIWDALDQPFMSYTWRSKRFILPGHGNFGAALVEGEDNDFTLGLGDPTASIADATLVLQVYPTTDADVDGPPAPPQGTFQATVFADGKPIRTFDDFNKVTRLPGGFLARQWEVEVRGQRKITAISIAQAPSELSMTGGQ